MYTAYVEKYMEPMITSRFPPVQTRWFENGVELYYSFEEEAMEAELLRNNIIDREAREEWEVQQEDQRNRQRELQ
jgi:hypothetical protein